MSEIEIPLRVVRVERRCANALCVSGKMLPSGNVSVSLGEGSGPPMYEHKCGHCGRTQKFYQTYPFTKYVEDKEDAPDIKTSKGRQR
ncbi:hypothetical protein [Paraburkholderia sp. BCC1886]|uniref:hypothetical protein n=1 Tax=Paraburkholderia sp. BCC1886 TaxID=2562670 RepID=UPI001182F8EB|nr:hypothetical protein [Paraburkholderia sp. BCC1886]